MCQAKAEGHNHYPFFRCDMNVRAEERQVSVIGHFQLSCPPTFCPG